MAYLQAVFEADARTRTGDPFITSEVLYQLSYVGEERLRFASRRFRRGTTHRAAPEGYSLPDPACEQTSAAPRTCIRSARRSATQRASSCLAAQAHQVDQLRSRGEGISNDAAIAQGEGGDSAGSHEREEDGLRRRRSLLELGEVRKRPPDQRSSRAAG